MKTSELTPMAKGDVQEFQHESMPISNVRNGPLSKWGVAKNITYMFKMLRLQGWYHKHGLPAGASMRKHWAKLTELLGFKPAYYVTYEYRNALWGFLWRGQRVLLYKSQRGLGIEVAKDFPQKLILPLMSDLIRRLRA